MCTLSAFRSGGLSVAPTANSTGAAQTCLHLPVRPPDVSVVCTRADCRLRLLPKPKQETVHTHIPAQHKTQHSYATHTRTHAHTHTTTRNTPALHYRYSTCAAHTKHCAHMDPDRCNCAAVTLHKTARTVTRDGVCA